jgi:hypothetical protein
MRFPEGRGPKIHCFPTLSAEKRGKDGARKSAANAKNALALMVL